MREKKTASDKQAVDSYIRQAPKTARTVLEKMRRTIRAAAPRAAETISYRIPTFKLNGNLVHFGAFRGHVSFFPASSGISAFKKELKPYKTSAGTIQFPLGQPVPYNLIRKITAFRVKENMGKNRE